MVLSVSGPQPGAKRFLHFLVLIIVLILFVIFLQHVAKVEKIVEKASIDKKVNEINSVLMVLTMEHVVGNKQDQLMNYHLANPFPLIMTRYAISNYFGEIQGITGLEKKGGWYFDVNNKDVIYLSLHGEISRYRMINSLADNASVQVAEQRQGQLGILTLQKSP